MYLIIRTPQGPNVKWDGAEGTQLGHIAISFWQAAKQNKTCANTSLIALTSVETTVKSGR